MTKIFKSISQIVLYITLFMIIQMLVNPAVNTIALILKNMPLTNAIRYATANPIMSSTTIIISSAVASLLTIALFTTLKFTKLRKTYLQSKPWATLFWIALMAIGAILPSMWMLEQLEIEVPSHVEHMLTSLLGNKWGYISVGILVPIAEEFVFRGAILRTLLKAFSCKWIAICISALVFGLAHGNMAQLPHAVIIGILLGWMYARTGSLIPGIVLHWVNNSSVFVLYNLIPGSTNTQLINLFGGNQQAVWLSLLFSCCIFLPSLYQVHLRMPRKEHYQKNDKE